MKIDFEEEIEKPPKGIYTLPIYEVYGYAYFHASKRHMFPPQESRIYPCIWEIERAFSRCWQDIVMFYEFTKKKDTSRYCFGLNSFMNAKNSQRIYAKEKACKLRHLKKSADELALYAARIQQYVQYHQEHPQE